MMRYKSAIDNVFDKKWALSPFFIELTYTPMGYTIVNIVRYGN